MAQNDINIKVKVDSSQAEQQTVNVRKRIKELMDQMTQLQLQGKNNTKEYMDAAKELGNLKDAIGDTAAQARIMSDDFFKQRAAMEGLSVGVNIFSGLTQVAALCGVENKNLQEVLVKLQAAQNLANTAMNISKALNKDTALMTALRAAKQKSLNTEISKGTVATTAGTAATGAFATAEGVATKGAISLKVAVKAVGTAIKSIPVIGWVLAAISAITTLIGLITSANDEEERGVKIRKEQIKLIDEQESKMHKVYNAVSEEKKHFDYIVDRLKKVKEGTSEWEDLMSEVSSITRISKDYLEDHPNVIAKVLEQQHELNKAQHEYNTYQELIQEHEEERQKARDAWLHGSDKEEKEAARVRYYMLDDLANSEKRLAENADADIKKYKSSLYSYMDIAKGWEKVQKDKEKSDKDSANAAAEAAKNQQAAIEAAKKEIEAAAKLRIKAREQELQEEIDKTKEGTEARVEAEWELLEYKKNIAKQEVAMREGYNRLSVEEKKALVREAESKYLEEQSELWNNYRTEQNQKEIDALRRTKDEELNIDKINADKKLIGLKEGTEEYIAALKDQYKAETAIALEELNRRREDRELSDDEYNALKLQKEEELQAKLEEIDAESTKKRNEARFAATENIVNQLSSLTQEWMDYELEAAGNNEKKQLEIKRKYAKMNFLSQIASIGIDTAKGIMSVWSTAGEAGPILGPILGGIQSALILGTGVAQTLKAHTAMNKALSGKAARGAFVTGRSHAQGGELYELEGGEAVLNKKAMSVPAFRALASAMNQATGGVSFPTQVMSASSSTPILSASIDRQVIRDIVQEVVAIPVVVSENDITTAQRNVSVISSRSRF